MNRINTVLVFVTLISSMLSCVQVYADGSVEANKKVSPLFQSSDPLILRINAPFRTIHRYRGKERPYQAATMILTDDDGKEKSLDLKIRVRGNFRSDRENCRYPPLKLNFKRKSLKNTVFEGENKLKLVVQCNKADRYKQFLILEYLNYKVFQLFTDYSLQVRMARIDYYDSENNRDLGTWPAFFIEDTGRMAKRLNLEMVKEKKILPGDYDQARLNLVDLFEFFIGNTDWSSIAGEQEDNCCHNIIPYRDRGGPIIPVPYDFDMTGVVDPSYAVVNPKLRINSITQRLYRGFCQPDALLQTTIKTFVDKRDKIYALYENQAGLSKEKLKSAIKYYDDFYDIMQKEERLKWNILNKCR